MPFPNYPISSQICLHITNLSPLRGKPSSLFLSNLQIPLKDIVLMEHNNTILLENSLLNNFKIYKNTQIYDLQQQKLVRVLVENRDQTLTNWYFNIFKAFVSNIYEGNIWLISCCIRIRRFFDNGQILSEVLVNDMKKSLK